MSAILRVLTYHRIADRGATLCPPSLISATPADFASQVGRVAAAYTPVGIDEVADAAAGGRPLPRRAVLITFDDGYRDFAGIAWPILKRFGIRPALFVSTSFASDPTGRFWWDRVYRALWLSDRADVEIAGERLALRTPAMRREAFARAKAHLTSIAHEAQPAAVDALCAQLDVPDEHAPALLDWPALRTLARDGVHVGAHGRTHALLTRANARTAREEVEGSLSDVARELSAGLATFCYPAGAYDDAVVGIVARAGAVLAFTVDRGHNDLRRADALRLRRTGVTRRTGTLLLRARLTRAGAMADRWRARSQPWFRNDAAAAAKAGG